MQQPRPSLVSIPLATATNSSERTTSERQSKQSACQKLLVAGEAVEFSDLLDQLDPFDASPGRDHFPASDDALTSSAQNF